MSYLVDATGENLQGVFSASPGNVPMTLACFIRVADWDTSNAAAFCMGINTTSWDYSHTIQLQAVADRAAFQSRDTASSGAPFTGTANQWNDIWVPIVGTTSSTSNRDIYVDAYTNSGNDPTFRGVGSSDMDVVTLGDRPEAALSIPLNGLIAHAALWTTALSQTDIEAFMAATSQADIEAIASASRVGYWPLNYNNATQTNEDDAGNCDLTVTNATYSLDDPFSGPVITDVNGTESWTDGDTGLVITGTGFLAT